MKTWKTEINDTNAIRTLYEGQYAHDLHVVLYEIEIGKKIWFLKTKAQVELDWHPDDIDY